MDTFFALISAFVGGLGFTVGGALWALRKPKT